MDCTRCGACCVAPDIAALDKPLGVRCPHLGADLLCAVYDHRPAVCRSYAADELCERIAAATLDERVARYLAVFSLEDEAARVSRSGATSMVASRRSLPLAPPGAGEPAPSRGLPDKPCAADRVVVLMTAP